MRECHARHGDVEAAGGQPAQTGGFAEEFLILHQRREPLLDYFFRHRSSNRACNELATHVRS